MISWLWALSVRVCLDIVPYPLPSSCWCPGPCFCWRNFTVEKRQRVRFAENDTLNTADARPSIPNGTRAFGVVRKRVCARRIRMLARSSIVAAWFRSEESRMYPRRGAEILETMNRKLGVTYT